MEWGSLFLLVSSYERKNKIKNHKREREREEKGCVCLLLPSSLQRNFRIIFPLDLFLHLDSLEFLHFADSFISHRQVVVKYVIPSVAILCVVFSLRSALLAFKGHLLSLISRVSIKRIVYTLPYLWSIQFSSISLKGSIPRLLRVSHSCHCFCLRFQLFSTHQKTCKRLTQGNLRHDGISFLLRPSLRGFVDLLRK